MTSSLVGSEMCIRDRWMGVCPCQCCKNVRGMLTGWGRRVGCGTGGFIPVSYTHLTLPTICSV
eukprot:935766-Prorocentrum_lima.AAC.1